MTKVVGVRFKDTGKTYYFDPKGLEIKKGDLVVVETARGMECGVAQYAPKEVAENEVTAPPLKAERARVIACQHERDHGEQ